MAIVTLHKPTEKTNAAIDVDGKPFATFKSWDEAVAYFDKWKAELSLLSS